MIKFKSLFKKLTTMSLALFIAAGMTTFVSAKTFEDIGSDHEYNEQIDLLSDIGVIIGTSENRFSPEESVTREQMALLLYRLMLGRDNSGNINTSPFSDIKNDTYFGAISWAYASGYILGTTDTTFEPLSGITLQDAMTIVVRALGQSNQNMNKGYPWTYIDTGVKLSLDNALENVAYTQILTRGQVAALLYNALTAEYLVSKTSSNGNSYLEKTSIIEKVFGYEITDSVLCATNNFAIGDRATVIKKNHVTLVSNETTMTVNFSDLALDGNADSWLGRELRVIYKADTAAKQIKVLGTATNGKVENVSSVVFSSDKSSVTIAGESYRLVEKLSDNLSTNANELLVYKYGNDGNLTQVNTTSELASLLGYFDLELIYDNRSSNIADRAIVKNYVFGKLDIDTNGKINLAGGLTNAQLNGGYDNRAEAVSGDYVLYYYNPSVNTFEISEKLLVKNGFVSRINGTGVTINGVEYSLGSSASGVDSAALLAAITVGREINFVVKDNTLLAVVNAPAVTSDSEYLISLTDAVPVYTDGSLKYIVTANINGANTQIFVSDPTVTSGKLYRYIKEANDIYVLFDIKSSTFTQTHEFSSTAQVEEKSTITRNSLPYYTFNNVNFVTDANTLIVVNNNGVFESSKGFFSHTIELASGANVTAIYKNENGNVETLSYLYVSNGHLANATSTSNFVKILSHSGYEYVDGTVYSIYNVYNFTTGAVEQKLSLNGGHENDAILALDTNAFITNTTAGSSYVTGTVTGFTGTTVMIDDTIYGISESVKIVALNNNNIINKNITDSLGKNVEVITNGSTVISIIIGADVVEPDIGEEFN